MAGHGTWRGTRHRRHEARAVSNPEYAEAYEAAEAGLLLGQRVHDRRVGLGLTQAELAQRAGLTQPQVSQLATGGATPSVPLLRRLARALDADVVIHRDTDGEGIGFANRGSAA